MNLEDLAMRLGEIADEAEEAGIHIHRQIHGVPRETFSTLPGDERRHRGRASVFWTKEIEGVWVYCSQPPQDGGA